MQPSIPDKIRAVWQPGMSASDIAGAIGVTKGVVSGHYTRNGGLRRSCPLTPATRTPDNDNKQRPATFDAAVLSYLPFMRKLAARLVPSQESDDLVQDTIENALAHWSSYNPAKKISGWLAWRMRAVLSHKRRRATLKTTAMGDYDAATPATQESAVIARDALSHLTGEHGDLMLVRHAAGESLQEMADEQGVSREMASSVARKARLRFAKRVGYRVVA